MRNSSWEADKPTFSPPILLILMIEVMLSLTYSGMLGLKAMVDLLKFAHWPFTLAYRSRMCIILSFILASEKMIES